jgi:hypothetical protein
LWMAGHSLGWSTTHKSNIFNFFNYLSLVKKIKEKYDFFFFLEKLFLKICLYQIKKIVILKKKSFQSADLLPKPNKLLIIKDRSGQHDSR